MARTILEEGKVKSRSKIIVWENLYKTQADELKIAPFLLQ